MMNQLFNKPQNFRGLSLMDRVAISLRNIQSEILKGLTWNSTTKLNTKGHFLMEQTIV
jgi:hypothetical protein